jgi:hypothetical protein
MVMSNLPFQLEVPLLNSEKKALKEEDQRSLVEIGLFNTGKRFAFQCPVCNKIEVNEQRMEIVCTGPHWYDEHPHELMIFIGMR